MEQGFKIIREGPSSFSVEGFFRDGPMQQFRAVSGFKTEVEARKWVYDQRVRDDEAATQERGGA
jgi:hypothetical protein